jgi:SAM-dependent methyltransferase
MDPSIYVSNWKPDRGPRAPSPEDARCLLCDRKLIPWLRVPGDWRRPTLGVSYGVGWCPDCALGRLESRLSAEEIEAAYRIPYVPHTPSPTSGFDQARSRSLLGRLRDRLVGWRVGAPEIDASWVRREFGERPLDVCEIGCGGGRILEAFRSAGHRVVGVEPGAEAREFAHAKGLEVLEGSAEGLPTALSTSRFDVVVMHHVLEHCENPIKALENARGLVRHHGVLVLETPNNEAESLRWAGPAWPWLDIPRHLQFFTASSLQRICEETGFEPWRTDFRGYARQFQVGWIELEQRIARFVRHRRGSAPRRAGSDLGRWVLLALTLLAAPRRRYDSVRVLARPSNRAC